MSTTTTPKTWNWAMNFTGFVSGDCECLCFHPDDPDPLTHDRKKRVYLDDGFDALPRDKKLKFSIQFQAEELDEGGEEKL